MHEAQEILKERARALARAVGERTPPAAGEPVIVFRLGETRAAVPLDGVLRVEPLDRLVRVPSVPRFVAGALYARDQIWVVLDIRERLGLPEARGAPTRALLLAGAGRNVALAADTVDAIEHPSPEGLVRAPEGMPAATRYVRAVTSDRVVILDPAAILADEELIVLEEVEAR